MEELLVRMMAVWIAVGFMAGCNTGGEHETKQVVALIDRMPDWPQASSGQRAEIARTVATIAKYSTPVLRSAFSELQARSPTQSSKKLLIINRYVFNLPPTIKRDDPAFAIFGGWWGLPIPGELGVPKNTDEMDLRWPWELDAGGEWKLTGTLIGYFGPPYPAVTAFDHYLTHFGRRN